jgi:hypothetical protein
MNPAPESGSVFGVIHSHTAAVTHLDGSARPLIAFTLQLAAV